MNATFVRAVVFVACVLLFCVGFVWFVFCGAPSLKQAMTPAPKNFDTRRHQTKYVGREMYYEGKWYDNSNFLDIPNDTWIELIVPVPDSDNVFVVFEDNRCDKMAKTLLEHRFRRMIKKKDERLPTLYRDKKNIEEAIVLKKMEDEINLLKIMEEIKELEAKVINRKIADESLKKKE